MKETVRPLDKRLGKVFFYAFWLILFGMLYLYFDNQLFPNQSITNRHPSNAPVVLKRDLRGHYIAGGLINDQPVTFLLDTGATAISIPATTAKRLALPSGFKSQVTTAAGVVDVYGVRLDQVQLGSIQQQNVMAFINPHQTGDVVLLGMSFLKHLNINQQNGQLILSIPN